MAIKMNKLMWAVFNSFFKDYSGFHLFNDGKSAFLLRNGKLYTYGEHHACFLRQESDEDSVVEINPKSDTSKFYPQEIKMSNNGIKSLCTGESHAALLDNDGNVFCWGSNEYCQLGVGHNAEINHPVKINITSVSQIACGQNFTIALTSDKEKIWLWGWMSKKFDYLEYSKFPKPFLISIAGVTFSMISAGAMFATALSECKEVYFWGWKNTNEVDHNGFRKIARKFIKSPECLDKNDCLMASCSRNRILMFNESFNRVLPEITNIEDSAQVSTISLGNASSHFRISSDNISSFTIASHWKSDDFVLSDPDGFHHKYNSETLSFNSIDSLWDEFNSVGWPYIQSSKISTVPHGFMPIDCPINAPTISRGFMNTGHLFESKFLTDLQINLKDGVLYAHKIILAEKSPVFKKTFSEHDDNPLKTIDVTNLNPSAYRSYIKYLYTGELSANSPDDLVDMCLWEPDNEDLMKKCLVIWKKTVNKDNVVSLFVKSLSSNLTEFMKVSIPIMKLSIKEIVQTEQYNSLSDKVKVIILEIMLSEIAFK